MGISQFSLSGFGKLGLLVATCGVLVSCGGNKPLEGDRFSIRPADVSEVENRSAAISLPAAVSNAEWTHENGSATHSFGHAAFSTSPSLRWSVDIGRGVGRDNRITSGPIFANGMVFVLDGAGKVSALTPNGETVWSLDTTPAGERGRDGSGGGISYSGGFIYAGTGYGEVLAIDAASGGVAWRRALDAPLRSAPTISGRTVYVVTRADVAYAIDASNGTLSWHLRGATAISGGYAGGASPAIRSGQLVLPFASGQILGVRANSGQANWSASLNEGRQGTVLSNIGDIAGGPVIDGNKVYVSNISGQTVQLSLNNGNVNWSIATGAYGPVWPVGGSVFMVSDQAKLMRINAANGAVIWSQDLPDFNNPNRRRGAIPHYGPVLAGGLLWVAGQDGHLRGFEPQGGQLQADLAIPGGAAAAPAIAGGVMYVLSQNGKLLAFQ